MYQLQKMKDFYTNPMGRGVSVIPNKQLIIDDFQRRFNVMEKSGKKFPIEVYYNSFNDTYFFHIIVPSETVRRNTYDVVIEFVSGKVINVNKEISNLNNVPIKIFSNNPAFVFSYGYVMTNYGLSVKFLNKKFDKEVLKREPVTKNPSMTLLYDKSIMFAIQAIMKEPRLMDCEYLKTICKPFNEVNFFKNIRHQDDILTEINKENIRLGLEKKKEKKEINKKITIDSKKVKREANKKTGSKIMPKQSTGKSSNKRILPKKSIGKR